MKLFVTKKENVKLCTTLAVYSDARKRFQHFTRIECKQYDAETGNAGNAPAMR